MAFDWVPREVVWYALRQKGVTEDLVDGVISLFKCCKTAVSVDGNYQIHFLWKLMSFKGLLESTLIYHGYILTEDVKDGSLIELLYADDLILCGESLNEVLDKYERWKNALEGKTLRVNVDKTRGMRLLFGKKCNVSKVDPCGVRREQVGCNSIQWMKCQRWVHPHCSDVPTLVGPLSC